MFAYVLFWCSNIVGTSLGGDKLSAQAVADCVKRKHGVLGGSRDLVTGVIISVTAVVISFNPQF